MFYYERFLNHEKAEKYARKLIPSIKDNIQVLHQTKHFPLRELEYFDQAVNEVIRCRHVLKYTYVYGYFLSNEKEKNMLVHI